MRTASSDERGGAYSAGGYRVRARQMALDGRSRVHMFVQKLCYKSFNFVTYRKTLVAPSVRV